MGGLCVVLDSCNHKTKSLLLRRLPMQFMPSKKLRWTLWAPGRFSRTMVEREDQIVAINYEKRVYLSPSRVFFRFAFMHALHSAHERWNGNFDIFLFAFNFHSGKYIASNAKHAIMLDLLRPGKRSASAVRKRRRFTTNGSERVNAVAVNGTSIAHVCSCAHKWKFNATKQWQMGSITTTSTHLFLQFQ